MGLPERGEFWLADLGMAAKTRPVCFSSPTTSTQEDDGASKENISNESDVPTHKFPPLFDYKPVPPFPQALVAPRKHEKNSDLYETFRKCEVNISLLNAIKQVPRYAKFLKELCNIKKKQKLK